MPEEFYNERFLVSAYYDSSFAGLAATFESDNWSEIAEVAHDYLSDGSYVEIKDHKTGKRSRIDPDVYFEDFDGEFPLTYKLEKDIL